MARPGPWLILAALPPAAACCGAVPAGVVALAWSFDGSRSWWVADARALLGGLAGGAAAFAVGVALAGIGAMGWSASAADVDAPGGGS